MNSKQLIKSAALLFRGFTFATAGEWLYLDGIKKYKRKNNIGMSDKDIFSLLPFDAKFDKLFGDALSTSYALARHLSLLPEHYYSLLTRDGGQFILPLRDGLEQSMDGVISLIRDKGLVAVRSSSNSVKTRAHTCGFDGDFKFDGEAISESDLCEKLGAMRSGVLISEYIEPERGELLHIAFLNEGDGPEKLFTCRTKPDNSAPQNWYTLNREISVDDEVSEEIISELKAIAAEFNELEYMNFGIYMTDSGYKIMRVDTGADLTYLEHFNAKTAEFIRRKRRAKPRFVSFSRAREIISRYFLSWRAKKRGFMDYMYRGWKAALRADTRHGTATRAEKKWAHERGFLSYRIKQYGLTDDNWREFLSDRDYKWLRPLNNKYRALLWDKVTLRYCLDEYSEYLPKYYYHIVPRDGTMQILKMPDLPAGYGRTCADILRLLREKGVLAMKPTVGSHGEGFYKLEYSDGRYLINGEEKTEREAEKFFASIRTYYNISEYIVMHEALRKIYAPVACTVRVMVINRTGLDPVIENAYFRIGTSGTGFTDNIGSGGVFAYVDAETGRFHDAEMIVDHVFSPCPNHPDTGVPIEGTLPHWDEARRGITDICRYIRPLEYLGFDVVITDAGFKILEINTHQDLHRYPEYNDDVHEYFMRKVKLKQSGAKLC